MSPRAFTQDEKGRVCEKLITVAERFLSTTGVRKTTVEALAKAAGISKGAFYLFYDSKELLFMDALDRAQEGIHAALIARIKKYPNKREGFEQTVLALYKDYLAKPWLVALSGEEYQALLTRVPQKRIAAHIQADDAASRRFCDELGCSKKVAPELLSAVLRMLFLGMLHREEVGQQAEQAFSFLLHALAGQLFKEGGK